jgi:predicted alpha/beta-fold hydrolase
VAATTECLKSPDGDNIELHHTSVAKSAARVLLLHGLEGSLRSHYVSGVFSQAAERNWAATLLMFRSCGSAANVARRFYHSGETTDLDFVSRALMKRWPESTWFYLGVSLGGNVLLKWLGEQGDRVDPRIKGAAAISVPFDLEAGARFISRGFSRVYDRTFLRSLRRKALAKLARYPELFDRERVERARTLYEFDDVVTGPVHGFADAHDYYDQSSSLRFLPRIRVPTLLLSAADDPFIPADVLRRAKEVVSTNASITAEFHRQGGHVGFVAGAQPWRPFYYGEWRVFRHFDHLMERS